MKKLISLVLFFALSFTTHAGKVSSLSKVVDDVSRKIRIENKAAKKIAAENSATMELRRQLWFPDAFPADKASQLIDEGADVNANSWKEIPFLSFAIQKGHKEAAIVMIEAGADLNSTDGIGKTPLMVAVYRHDIKIAKALIDSGRVDLEVADRNGRTALDIAVSRRKHRGDDMIKLLVEAGAVIDPKIKLIVESIMNTAG